MKIKINEYSRTNDVQSLENALKSKSITIARVGTEDEGYASLIVKHSSGIKLQIDVFFKDNLCDINELNADSISNSEGGLFWGHPDGGIMDLIEYRDFDDLATRLKGIADATKLIVDIYHK